MKARADQAHTVIIGEARSPVGVSLGLRLIGDEEVATVTLSQHDRTVTLYVTDQAHAAQIAAAIQGQPPLAAEGEPVGEVRFGLGAPSSIFAELYSKSLPALAPGTKLYATPQPAKQQPCEAGKRVAEQKPAPDVAGLAGKMARLIAAGNRLNAEAEECTYDDGMAEVAGSEYWCEFRDALEAATEVLAAHRKQGG